MIDLVDQGGHVLVSTHDLEVAGGLRSAFQEAGYTVELVTPTEDVSAAEDVGLLVLTGGLETSDAVRMARTVREVHHAPVIGLARAGAGGPPAGIADYLADFLPVSARADEVLFVGRSLIERLRLRRVTGIVGETDAMQEALERVVHVAPVDSTVLLTGESGTGKELVARGIHALSPRRHKPFIAVNVAALAETLLESELFGHEKGAFTGAIDARRGLFELAHGGTIFLDEIGEMPVTTQTKLLRVLEQREFLRVGGETTIRVDVRIIAATNQDLRQLVAIGGFRKDLYYRLNVLHIELPPLRRRRGDIPLLVDSFIREASARLDRPFRGISPEAMQILHKHHWPGNVRELQNLVESMVVLAPGSEIVAADIPAEVRGESSSLLPVPVGLGPPKPVVAEAGRLRPELEFVFRTLVELRIDVDDLRSEFEAYREKAAQPLTTAERWEPALGAEAAWERPEPPLRSVEPVEFDREAEIVVAVPEDVVIFRPGMTMDDLEERAISVALSRVSGNRRKASEILGIGERTLYRKIKKYGLEEERK
jgi:DNA-binding NtrC family response regulator